MHCNGNVCAPFDKSIIGLCFWSLLIMDSFHQGRMHNAWVFCGTNLGHIIFTTSWYEASILKTLMIRNWHLTLWLIWSVNYQIAHFQVPKNGTSSARIQKRRPLIHVNMPPNWWIGHLFFKFPTFGWEKGQISLSTDPKIEMPYKRSVLKKKSQLKVFWGSQD